MRAAFNHARWACQERSTERKDAWTRALRRGCLTKSIHQDIPYSHFKALSEQQLGRSNLFGELGSDVATEALDDEEAELFNFQEAEKRFQPALASPVIEEDLTHPPKAIEDVTTALFTVHEFFNYLKSPDWPDTVRLRVVEGELLRALHTALVSLEKRYLIGLRSVRAYANNRVDKSIAQLFKAALSNETVRRSKEEDGVASEKEPPVAGKAAKSKKKAAAEKEETKELETKTDSGEVLPDQSSDTQHFEEPVKIPDIQLVPPVPYQTDPQWVYEKLRLEIIFYEKSEKSNIPYDTQDYTDFDYFEELPEPKPLMRPLVREAHSLKRYQLNQVRLPPYENIEASDYIATLEHEALQVMERQQQLEEEAKTKVLDKNKPQGTEAKSKDDKREEKNLSQDEHALIKIMNMKAPDVEDIAEDPFLVREETLEKPSTVNKKIFGKTLHEESSQEKIMESDEDRKSFYALSNTAPEKRTAPTSSNASFDQALMNVSGSDSGSFGSNTSEWELVDDLEDDEDESDIGLHQLYLTGQELQVSSVYAPREQNQRGVEKKLEAQRRMRAKLNNRLAEQIFESAALRARGDLHASFKHLARRREAQRIRASAPKMTTRFRKIGPGHPFGTANHSQQPDPRGVSASSGSTSHDITSAPLRVLKPREMFPVTSGMKDAVGQVPVERVKSMQVKTPGVKKVCEIVEDLRVSDAEAKKRSDIARRWENYRKVQDKVERESELKNDLERGILERIPTRNFHPNYKPFLPEDLGKDKPKTKPDKNKSHNKSIDMNGNWLRRPIFSHKFKSKHYPDYNLFLSMNGRIAKITQPDLKSNIIKRSFCVDGHGSFLSWQKRPPVKRIGFASPEHLMKYLVSVRNSLIPGDVPKTTWQSTSLQSSLSNPACRRATKQMRSYPQCCYVPSWLTCDSNNSGLRSEKHQLSRVTMLKNILKASNEDFTSGNSQLRGQSLLKNANKSANADETEPTPPQADEILATPTSPPIVTEGFVAVAEDVAEAEAGAEADAEADDGFREDHRDTIRPVEMTESQTLEEDLKCYGEGCVCDECYDQAFLAHLKPTNLTYAQEKGCPPILGRLRRDYNFLKTDISSGQKARERLDSSGKVKLPQRPPVLDTFQVGQQLLDIMNDIMIRKEILSSSRGFNYITFTFTKYKSKSAVLKS